MLGIQSQLPNFRSLKFVTELEYIIEIIFLNNKLTIREISIVIICSYHSNKSDQSVTKISQFYRDSYAEQIFLDMHNKTCINGK